MGAIINGIRNPLNNLKQIRDLTSLEKDEDSIMWALRDVSFDVQQGDVLGIIGHNGAGKSTLLKILSRITEPSEGEVLIRGRVAALLEVGTGFHPELTGRENIYMNGTILGMRKKEIDLKLDEIVSFSGVERYLDTPVKFYSSGMRVRLGFSVAAHLEPEILIIDEVLSVGDAEFQKKCLGKMEDVAQVGRTVLFVSHNMNAIQTLCPRSILLLQGRKVGENFTEHIVNDYLNNIGSSYWWRRNSDKEASDKMDRVVLKEVICSKQTSISLSDQFYIDVVIDFLDIQAHLIHVNLFFKAQGENAFVACSSQEMLTKGTYRYRFFFPAFLFNNLNYQIDVMIVNKTSAILHLKELLIIDFIDDTDMGWKGHFPGYLRPKIETITEKV